MSVSIDQHTEWSQLVQQHSVNTAYSQPVTVHVGCCGASLSLLPCVRKLGLKVVSADETPDRSGDMAARHFATLFGVKPQRCGNER